MSNVFAFDSPKMTGHLLYGKWGIKKVHRLRFIVKSFIKGPL